MRPFRIAFVVVLTLALALVAPFGAGTALAQGGVVAGDAAALAAALDPADGVIVGASSLGTDPIALGVGTAPLGNFFPTTGGTFAIMSTGAAGSAGLPNDAGNTSTILGGIKTAEGYDLAILQLTVNVPSNATCLSFDFAFYSEEFPEFVGNIFNDTFVAQLGDPNYTFSGQDLSAPGNFAFDNNNQPITVNTSFGVTTGDTQSTYDGGTELLRAFTPVTPGGPVTLSLSLFDRGDSIYDSAVFFDNLQLTSPDPADCQAGAAPVPVDEQEFFQPALVTAVHRPTPNYGAANGSLISYEIEVTNRGIGRASNASVSIPYNESLVEIVDATFSREGAWVSQLTTDTVKIDVGPLGGEGDSVTATLRMRVKADAPAGSLLGQRMTVRWGDAVVGGTTYSNLTILAVAGADDNRPTYGLAVEPTSGPSGTSFFFGGDIFAPDEPVGWWYNTPDGQAVEVATYNADKDGFAGLVGTTDLAPGTYTMVAYGHWTEFTAVATFVIE